MILKPGKFTWPPRGERLVRNAGFWLCNEGSGNVHDLSGNNNTGVLTGTAPSWTAGKYGPAVNLPGTDEYINCGTSMFGSTPNGLSVVVAGRPTSDIADSDQIIGRDAAARPINVYVAGTTNVAFYTRNTAANGNVLTTTTTPIAAGQDFIIVCTWDNTTKKIYVNGKEEASGSHAGPPGWFSTSYTFTIGSSGSTYFPGRIDFAQLLPYALSAWEVTTLLRNPFSMFEEE